jgi:hypothetical protein
MSFQQLLSHYMKTVVIYLVNAVARHERRHHESVKTLLKQRPLLHRQTKDETWSFSDAIHIVPQEHSMTKQHLQDSVWQYGRPDGDEGDRDHKRPRTWGLMHRVSNWIDGQGRSKGQLG